MGMGAGKKLGGALTGKVKMSNTKIHIFHTKIKQVRVILKDLSYDTFADFEVYVNPLWFDLWP